MPATQVRGAQVRDSSIQRDDIDTTTPGQAIVAKLVQGDGIQLSSTGGDAGTGDVTVGLGATIPTGVVTTLYIGSKARLTALSNGLRLEVQDTGNNWIIQQEWTEA
jgi:NAD(P)-dependent dehydrogenase (short-subunit alcohol dehydrogenase family)